MKSSRTIDQSPICLLFLNWSNECVQLVDNLKENDLYEIFQSAYRQLHSTETVQNDILQAVDSEGGAILVLLAFDTIGHQKLLDLLDYSFGIRGDTFKSSLKTYLFNVAYS